MCTLLMHMGRHDYSEVVLTLFRSIRFSKMSFEEFKRDNTRVSNFRCCIQALKLNHVCCCFTSASGLDSLFIRHTRLKDDIYPSHSLDRSSDVFVYFTSKVVGQTGYGQRYCSATSLWHRSIPKTLIILWRIAQDTWTNL